MFEGKIAVVTGGAQGIGRTIAGEFEKNGAKVCVIDKQPGVYYTGDLADEKTLERFAAQVIADYGHIDYLINNALPLMKGIDSCTWQEFNYALKVGVSAPFYLSKLFLPYFNPGASIVNISSSRDRMSQPNTESYTAAKGGIELLRCPLLLQAPVHFSGSSSKKLTDRTACGQFRLTCAYFPRSRAVPSRSCSSSVSFSLVRYPPRQWKVRFFFFLIACSALFSTSSVLVKDCFFTR